MLIIEFTIIIIAIILVFFGNFCNSMAFGAVFNFSAELFPTTLRATGIGFGSSVARIGGILAPQIIQLKKISSLLPPLVIGIIALFGAIVAFFMPETNDNPLMQTAEEAQRFYRQAKLKPRRLM